MRYFSSFDEEQQPVTTWRGHPIYAAHLIVAVLVASMLVTTGVLAFKAGSLLDGLIFVGEDVLRGQVWRVATYGLVNAPSLWFAVDMLMLVWFGREVEKALGRTAFLRLYGCLYLIPPVLLTPFAFWRPTMLAGEAGSLAIFVAFATYFPNIPMMFNLLAKWVAIILVGLYTLMALAGHDWTGLLVLWATCGFAFAYIRHAKGDWEMPSLRLLKPAAPTARGTGSNRSDSARGDPRRSGGSSASPNAKPADSLEGVDAILDKIASQGMHSLTPQERARLDKAQARLAKRRDGG
ncbi:MAG: rhomboid family intramembrane serine protease, partial [Burkholderiales bacterium]|nr:rhomboid family intramembrane serine protease [Opitutaceae bacterium]